jgi:hypothetical protein
MVRAQVREDGIAYYGVARSLIIDHNLQFKGDWKTSNLPSMEIRDQFGRLTAVHISKTGHLPVHSAIGASLMWMPFIAATHAAVLALDSLGAKVAATGFSEPYLVTLAAATCLYAFLGLWMSFSLAGQYAEERWAFLATVALWLASSLPAYIYVDPAWSHAHSVFVVALFLWYWQRTRENRSATQWFVLGLISGLMAEVYFPNAVLLMVIVSEFLVGTFGKARRAMQIGRALRNYALYGMAILIAFTPTFVIRAILFGSPLAAGAYGDRPWNWTAPAFVQILFSASQGLLTTTPVVLPSIIGLFFLARKDAVLGRGLIAAFLALWTLMAVYPFWNLGPSFGNRYFISLIPAFIIGLATLLSECARAWGSANAFARRAWTVAVLLIIWNVGLLFQWSTGLMPDVGRVYWSEILYNQFRIVPSEALHALYSRFSFQADNQEAASEADVPKS